MTQQGHQDYLIKFLEKVSNSEDHIKQKVERIRHNIEVKFGHKDKELDIAVTDRLIKNYSLSTAISGAISSLFPPSLPIIGRIGTFVTIVAADIGFLLAKQFELCFAIAFANKTKMSQEELKCMVLVLMELSNFEDIKQRAKNMGVHITFKKFIEKAVALSLERGFTHSLHHTLNRRIFISPAMASGMTRSVLQGSESVGLFGVPLGIYLNFHSTRELGLRAKEYFLDSSR